MSSIESGKLTRGRKIPSKAMSADSKKFTSSGCDNPLISKEQQEKIEEVRRLVWPPPEKLYNYCSDASISRYLRAWNWNVKKATKKLKETLKWRLEYKPEEIRWDEVASEAETGKLYRPKYGDKHGRTILVFKPRYQNSNSTKEQIRYLVYCVENAIKNLPAHQEEIICLVDFYGYGLSNFSIQATRETGRILQDYYPERLAFTILYNPPKFFEPFWTVVKPCLAHKIASKVKFVYSGDPNTKKIMEDLFDMDLLESAFGGKANAGFDLNEYAERMREDDKREQSLWARGNVCQAAHQPSFIPTISVSDSNPSELDEKANESSSNEGVLELVEKADKSSSEEGVLKLDEKAEESSGRC